MIEMTDAKRRLVERLKRVDSASAGELAAEFQLTDTAVRQHLESLQDVGLVRRVHTTRVEGATVGRGRPAARWQLTGAASGAFPDRHVDLTVDLIESIRSELGDDALDIILGTRAQRQTDHYRTLVGTTDLAGRVERLAEQRTAEGYAAEVVPDGGAIVLIEHHCPIAVAAAACRGLCHTELAVFQAALGDDVTIERTHHIFAGDQRCAYKITATQ